MQNYSLFPNASLFLSVCVLTALLSPLCRLQAILGRFDEVLNSGNMALSLSNGECLCSSDHLLIAHGFFQLLCQADLFQMCCRPRAASAHFKQ